MNRLLRISLLSVAIFLSFCLTSNTVIAQAPLASPYGVSNMDSANASLSDMVVFMRSHLSSADTAEGGPQALVDAFEGFWSKRVVNNDNTTPNMFERYLINLNASSNARKTGGTCPAPNVWGGNWICNGPDSLPNQNIGYITCVWVDPADTSKLLVGTHGGLFKSIDGGLHWNCITDNAPINNGLIDIYSIAVHPTGKDTIYCGTSSEPFIPNPREWGWRGKDYGVSVIYTTDGGATWHQEFPRALNGTPQWYDSILSVGSMYFSPNGNRLYASANGRLYHRSYPSGLWKDDGPKNGLRIFWDDMRYLINDDTTFYIPGTNKWIYKGRYHATTQLHSWDGDSVRLPAITYPAFLVRDTNGTAYTMPSYVMDSFEQCRLRITPTNSMYALLRSHTRIPDTAIAAHGPLIFDNSSDYDPKDALCRYHLETGTWTVNTIAIPQLGQSGSGSCFTFCVSTYDTNNVYYGNGVAQFATNGGRRDNNWLAISTYDGRPTHGDIRSMTPYSFQASSVAGAGDRVYFATDGGVMMKPFNIAPTNAVTCKNLDGKGLAVGDYAGVGTSEGGNYIVGGAAHVGYQAYESDKNPQWAHINWDWPGDKENVVFSRTNPTKAYGNEWQGIGALEETNPSAQRRIDDVTHTDDFYESPAFIYPSMWADQFGSVYVGLQHIWRYDPGFGLRQVGGTVPSGNPDIQMANDVDANNREIETAALTFSTYFPGPVGYVVKVNGHMFFRSKIASSFSGPSNTPAFTESLPPTGVAMDMANPDRVWLSLGGENRLSTPRKRVYYSANHGQNWFDISKGLPIHLPVTAIVYQEGTPYAYASTDVGIYRADMSKLFKLGTSIPSSAYDSVVWTCFNTGKVAGKDFPSVSVSKLEINYCQGRLYASTYGRSIWSTDLMLENPNYYSPALGDRVPDPTLIIDQNANVTWSSDMRIYSGVHLLKGSRLTINNTGSTQTVIHMPKNGAFQVDTGATLIVDGAKITNDCDGMWKGIMVAGVPNQPLTQFTKHGHVYIQNGAVIEHARLGVANCLESLVPNWGTTAGGIIKIDNSFFYNNARGVGFAPYHNKYSGRNYDDSSYIKGSTFEINNSYRGVPLNYYFQAHINMESVDGINIQGDTFRNINSDMPYTGYGITSWSSSYNVIPYCVSPGCSISAYKHNVFQGFKSGINSNDGGLNPLNYCFVDYADFKGNSVGIYAKYNNWCQVFHNKFEMDTAGYPYSNTCYCVKGVYLRNTPQFRIEENTFGGYNTHRANSGILQTFGAHIDSSGVISSEIYHNTFNGIDVCIGAWGQNGTRPANKFSDPPGLQALCNTFNNQGTGIFVNGAGASGLLGIRYIQGSANRPVENVYNPLFPTGCKTNWSSFAVANNGWRIISFWHNSIPSSSTCSGYSAAVGLMNTTNTNTCLSRKIVVPASYSGTTYKLVDAKADVLIKKTAWQNAVSDLDGKVDGGNTTQLLAYISQSNDGQAIHDSLVQLTPYLSENVLKAAAAPTKVSESLMLDVLIGCPEMLTESLMAYLRNFYGPVNMDNLETHRNDVSQRSYDDANINDNYSDMVRAHADVIGFLKHDSDGMHVDTLAYWYKQLPALWPRYATALMYLGEGDYNKSDAAMADIASDFELGTGDSLAVYNSYTDLIDILKPALQNGRTELQLDSAELAGLLVIAGRGHADVSFLAQNIYDENLGIKHIPCPLVPAHDTDSGDGGGGIGLRMVPKSAASGLNSQNLVNVYPNPARDYVTFSFNIPIAKNKLMLTVTTLSGQVVYTAQLADKIGRHDWNCNQAAPGTYFYKINDGQKTISTGKISVVR